MSILDKFKLDGKVALVTGASVGLGQAMAIALAEAGADVAVHCQFDGEGGETCEAIAAHGRKAFTIQGDMSDKEAPKRIVQSLVDEFGRLDILINNAAFQTTHDTIEAFTTEEFDRTFKTNVYAMFWLCRAAIPRMPAGAVIINTASIQAYDPSANLLAYAATKGAIVNFTKSLAQQAMKGGIRVNAVAPGPVWTPLIPSTMPEEKVKTFGHDTLLERAAQPVELAPLYVFLASNESRFVTGEVYGATGGQTPY
jgi:NAD(P)-dependent dehydrogenase (short-subunit alcohol dehydrogenase family)